MEQTKIKNYSYEEVLAAETAQNGGRYRLICNRKIDGKQCRCYAREFILGENRYWNIGYVIDGKAPERYNGFVKAMNEIAEKLSEKLSSSGIPTIMWKY